MNRRAVLSVVLVATLLATQAMAERLVRPVTDVTTIGGPVGACQVAFRCDPTITGGNVAVRQALVRFDLQGEPEDRALTVRVYPVTAPWSFGVPRVVYDAELWSRTEVDLRHSGPVVMDLTNLVKEIVEHGMTSYGFVVAAGPAAEGMTQGEAARFSGLSSATMEVTWRRTPESPAEAQHGRQGQRKAAVHRTAAQQG
jgi:hypothetical protein